jgi:hypothetical protein
MTDDYQFGVITRSDLSRSSLGCLLGTIARTNYRAFIAS